MLKTLQDRKHKTEIMMKLKLKNNSVKFVNSTLLILLRFDLKIRPAGITFNALLSVYYFILHKVP
jgi:hypothetical protein